MKIKINCNLKNENGQHKIGDVIEINDKEKKVYEDYIDEVVEEKETLSFTDAIIKEHKVDELKDLNVEILTKIAKNNNVEKYYELNKDELIKAIVNLEE